MNKDQIVGEIRQLMEELYAGPPGTMEMSCLFWAKATCLVVEAELGERCIAQAGTACWPRIALEDDDGQVLTHFSYVFEPDNPLNILRLKNRQMPEMHVWAALPDSQTVIDVTTGFQPGQCELTMDMDWPGPKPPPYIWANADEMPDGYVYQADMLAIDMAFQMYRTSDWGETK